MAGTFEIISILQRELGASGISAHTLAIVSGITDTKLSKYLRGAENCGGDHASKLVRAWEDLRKLREIARPIPIDYARVAEVKQCLALMRESKLQVIAVCDAEPQEFDSAA